MASVLLPASLLLAVLMLIPELFGDFMAYQIGLYLIYGIAAQGIGYLWGKTGVLPLGQALFFGVAAYVTAIALRDVQGLGAQLVLALLVLAVLAGAAFVLATLIFRGRSESGPYFSLVTLALAMIAEQVAGTATGLTGGFNGLSGFQSLAALDPFGGFYYVIVAATVLVSLLLLILNRLPATLIARAVADNEPRLQLLGFPTHVVKGMAFAFSAVIAALAGGLFASHQGIVTPTSTGFALSAELVILAAVGGRFHVFGPLLGAVVVGWASAELRDSFPYWELLMAVAFILVVLKAPGGLAELIERAFRQAWPAKPPVPQPPLEAPPPLAAQAAQPLKFQDVELRIGVVRILNGVSFETPATGIVSIIGPNGAGKTSALNTITGNLHPTGGSICLGDARIDMRPPYRALGSGIGRKLQVPSVFFSMSVSENLTIAMMAGRARRLDYLKPSTFRWRSAALARVLEHPSVPLKDEVTQPVGTLPQGHRQFLEFAMTAASAPPVLLLDEPCAGLSPDETALMTDLVRQYQAETGALVIVIEHDMSIVEAISDKVLVLHQGRVLAFDTYAAIRADPQVSMVYAGGTK
ncbi:ATP-binding cassette domain-containing protein [Aestuariivita sp.]|jgi:branched-chain amino acid transport system permease protein|uniref:branched-chain amino acid ABC transporter ATP-binding protein/permease n=1 Tax=Aestuariivita sp. TaxID=1872407 RepID=UPI00216C95D2|nr:ATP-binding cassette domain-containing protein [Aestuariivita sp.]MCE8007527.1 ATP-binding cassette domain-containing protein [Aestuariivita sp.]